MRQHSQPQPFLLQSILVPSLQCGCQLLGMLTPTSQQRQLYSLSITDISGTFVRSHTLQLVLFYWGCYSCRLGMHFARGIAAVQWCWVTAQLYEEPIVTGVSAVA